MNAQQNDDLSSTTSRLGTERIGKLLLRLSVPSIISLITVSLYHFADTIWLGRLSYQAIAAAWIAFPFFVIVIAIGNGTGVGVNALASRRFGEKDTDSANSVAGQVFPLSIILGAIFILVSVLYSQPMASFLGAGSDIKDMAASYLFYFGCGAPFMIFRLMTRNVFQASGDAIKPMIFTMVGAVINIILDPFFIFGWGPFPQMGVGGAGLATSISGAIGAALSFFYLISGKSVYRIGLHHMKPNFSIIKRIYRVGLPTILMELTESAIFVLFNRIVGEFGSAALATLGIAGRIADFSFMLIIGTAHGVLPIVGFCYGAQLRQRLWATIKVASLGLAVLLGIATILLEVFAPQAISIFNSDPELLEVGVPGMRIFVSTLILIGPTIIFITAFQGLSKGWTATILSLARQIVFFLPAILILPRYIGITGVWAALPISDACGAIISAAWLYREYRLQRRSDKWQITPAPDITPNVLPHGISSLDE